MVSDTVPELETTSEMFPAPINVLPVTFTDDATDVHAKVVPTTFAVGTNVAVAPEQIACVNVALVMDGAGSMLTTKFTGKPVQPFALGVIT